MTMSAAHRCVVVLQFNVMPQLCFLATQFGGDWSALCAQRTPSTHVGSLHRQQERAHSFARAKHQATGQEGAQAVHLLRPA